MVEQPPMQQKFKLLAEQIWEPILFKLLTIFVNLQKNVHYVIEQLGLIFYIDCLASYLFKGIQ